MRITKKTISQKLLELLQGGVASTIDIVWAMSAPKSVSYKRLRYLRDNSDITIGKKIINDWKNYRGEYKRYHALLSRLEEQGLVEAETTDKNKVWSVTTAGRSFLRPKEGRVHTAEVLATSGQSTIIS